MARIKQTAKIVDEPKDEDVQAEAPEHATVDTTNTVGDTDDLRDGSKDSGAKEAETKANIGAEADTEAQLVKTKVLMRQTMQKRKTTLSFGPQNRVTLIWASRRF